MTEPHNVGPHEEDESQPRMEHYTPRHHRDRRSYVRGPARIIVAKFYNKKVLRNCCAEFAQNRFFAQSLFEYED